MHHYAEMRFTKFQFALLRVSERAREESEIKKGIFSIISCSFAESVPSPSPAQHTAHTHSTKSHLILHSCSISANDDDDYNGLTFNIQFHRLQRVRERESIIQPSITNHHHRDQVSHLKMLHKSH
jgi:hypothetical protein